MGYGESPRHLPILFFGYVSEWGMRKEGRGKNHQAEGHMDMKRTLVKQSQRSHPERASVISSLLIYPYSSECPSGRDQKAKSPDAVSLGTCGLNSATKPIGLLSNILLPSLALAFSGQIWRQGANS